MGGRVISHLIKTTAKVESCRLRGIGGQTYLVKMHGSVFQQLMHQGLSSLPPTVIALYVDPAKPSNARSRKGITRQTADCDPLPFTKHP